MPSVNMNATATFFIVEVCSQCGEPRSASLAGNEAKIAKE